MDRIFNNNYIPLPYRDDASFLKKLGKGIANVAHDAIQLGEAPIKQAISSVTGKPVETNLKTGVGKVINAVQSTGAKALNTTVKSAADVITMGAASKLANVVRKDQYKEKPFDYNESRTIGNTGVKIVDKIAPTLGTVSKVVGGVAGGYSLASGIKSAAEKLNVPSSALSALSTGVASAVNSNTGPQSTQLLNDMKNGTEQPATTDGSFLSNATASMSPTNLLLIGGAVLLLVLLASSKHGQRAIKRYRK